MALTFIELSSRNLEHNLRQFKNINPTSELWPVVKSNAYGHGQVEIVKLLDDSKLVAGLALVNLEEALFVSTLSTKPLMVLSYFDFDQDKIREAVERNIILPVFNQESLEYLRTTAQELDKKILVAIKIDSGTNRLGFKGGDEELVDQIFQCDNLVVQSIYTHFADSESQNLDFTKQQLNILNNYQKKYPHVKFHAACSAAAIALPEARLDIVRLGLSLYGLWPSLASRQRGEKQGLSLLPVLSLKTKIIQIKKVLPNESIGYNRTFVPEHSLRLAILPIGYYEGLPRLLSNNGQVLINGQRCQLRGNICMNLSMVELPEQLEAKVGDEVVVIGQSGQDLISSEELASKAQTITYEILARLNYNLPKIIIP